MKSYVFDYDMNLLMLPVSGKLIFSEDGTIRSLIDKSDVFEISADRLSEVLVKAGVGCGLLYVKIKGNESEGEPENESEKIICRFTMSGLKKAGDFCKIANYYINTGIAEIPDIPEKRICEKCGRPLIEEINVCVFCYNKISVIKRTLIYLKPYARKFITAQLFLTLSSALFLITPILSRVLIDDYLRPRTGTWQQVALLALIMLLARGLGETIFILNARVFNKVSISFCNDLRIMAYDKLQSLSMASFSKRTPGDLIRRIMEDTTTIREFITDGGRWAIEMMIMFTIVTIILLITDAKLTLLIMAPVPVVMYALSRFWVFIRNRYERQWRKESRASSILHDIVKGIRTVKSFGNEATEIKKFADVSHELARISSNNESLWAILFPLLTFFTGVGEFLLLFFGGRAVINGTLSMGVLVQFTMFLSFIYNPLRWLVAFPRWLANATTSMLKLYEIMDEEPEIAEKEDSIIAPITGGVNLEGVSFGYKSYEPVLKGINLEIKPGEMIGLVGKSGVGKTTLINLVMRLYDPNIGKITINGTDIRDISPKYLHENIGVVFQDNFLFAGTFFDNITYAKPDATPEEVIAASRVANAHEFIMNTPDGYNTLIGEGGQDISAGERQRLSIARAVIKDPDILILDEATSSLDVETEAEIQESLGRLIKGRTTIAIAHRLSTLKNANRLIVLDKGNVAEDGTHIELLKKKGIYYNLVMAQRQSGKTEAT